MAEIRLFVEGVADIKFLKDYIHSTYNVSLESKHLYNCKGWQNIDAVETINEFKTCAINNITPLIIFDADSPAKDNGGVINRKEEIQARLRVKGIEVADGQMYLWPNNSDDGDLETLLERIISEANRPLMECWDSFETCIQSKEEALGRALTIPAKKAKIHTYCTMLLPDSNSGREKAKEEKRVYTDGNWDLSNDALTNLKGFLTPYFTS